MSKETEESREAMQLWADKALARMAHQPAALIVAFHREAYHFTGYCWGVPGHERGNNATQGISTRSVSRWRTTSGKGRAA
jgi:hypothetical protein